jgi:hypothetical protein
MHEDEKSSCSNILGVARSQRAVKVIWLFELLFELCAGLEPRDRTTHARDGRVSIWTLFVRGLVNGGWFFSVC